MRKLTVKFNKITSATDKEKEKLYEAKRLIELHINSEEFKNRVINHEYRGLKMFVQSNSFNNEQIYELIMTGSEILLPEKDGEIDVDLTVYKSSWVNRRVVGFTFPSTVRTWINRRFLSSSSFEAGDVAGNIVHEWCHKIGFDHDFKSTARRPYSVPYAVGNIIKDLCENDDNSKRPKRKGFWAKVGLFFRNLF